MCRLLLVLCVLPALCAASPGPPETGEFRLTSTLTELLGAAQAQRLAAIYPPGEAVRWEVYVPPAYDPGKPAGLLVYISPTPDGMLPERWKTVLDAHNLIWVSAEGAGNAERVQRRALFALVSPTLIEARYALDRDRIYVAGLSGGGKMASMVATDHAQLFRGAIYICGVEFWDAAPSQLDRIRQNRYVFLTGEYDQALRPTRRAYGRYRKAGVEQVLLLEVDGMGHENPQPDVFAEALDFLDGGDDAVQSPVARPPD